MTEPQVLEIIAKIVLTASIAGFVIGAFLRMRK